LQIIFLFFSKKIICERHLSRSSGLGLNFEDFAADRKTVNAVIRSLEVLGEATKHIPISFRQDHSEIPWSKMAGMRDVLIHDYMGVDLKTIWKVIQERLPELEILLDRCLFD